MRSLRLLLYGSSRDNFPACSVVLEVSGWRFKTAHVMARSDAASGPLIGEALSDENRTEPALALFDVSRELWSSASAFIDLRSVTVAAAPGPDRLPTVPTL